MAGAMERPRLPLQSHIFFSILLAALLILVWWVFRPFVIFMVTGLLVAVLALPIDRFWERVAPNRLAAFCTMFSVLVILIVPVLAIGIALVGDAQELAEDLQDGKARAWVDDGIANPLSQQILAAMFPENTTEERNATAFAMVEDGLKFAETQLVKVGIGIATQIGGVLIATIVILFVVYYVLVDGDRLVRFLERALPLPPAQVREILSEARNGLNGVFMGQILTSLIQGAIGGIGFLIAGVPGAILWAGVMAVLSLLPVVGAFLVWVPAAILLLVQGQIWQGIFLFAWGLIVVSNVDNFVRPRLIGDRTDIHPIFVLLGVLGGVAAFGFIGLFLGPLLVGVTQSVLRVWEHNYLDPAVRVRPDAQSVLDVEEE